MSYYFWAPSQQNELYHYGVLGMKWGVHKAYRYNNKIRNTQFKQMHIEEKSPLGKKDPRIAELNKKNYENAEKRDAAAKAAVSKSKAHLEKLESRYQTKQARADKAYEKAERKANSVFASKRSAEKAFRKAAKVQYKANKVAYKGKKFYQEMVRSMSMGRPSGRRGLRQKYNNRSVFYPYVDKETKKMGEEFIKRVERSSKAMYANSYR